MLPFPSKLKQRQLWPRFQGDGVVSCITGQNSVPLIGWGPKFHQHHDKILKSSPWTKMFVILQSLFSDTSPWIKRYVFWFKKITDCFLYCPIDNNPALIYIMAWHRIGDKPLFELILIRFIDAYVRHWGVGVVVDGVGVWFKCSLL